MNKTPKITMDQPRDLPDPPTARMTHIRVSPVDGRRVRDPRSKRVLAKPVIVPVPVPAYWTRRHRAGDVAIEALSEETMRAMVAEQAKEEAGD